MLPDSSPTFDTPDLPSIRRTKPLPKRRRTSESSSREDTASFMGHTESGAQADDASLETPDGFVSTESLLALQSYYMPILGDMQDLLKHETEGGGLFGGREYAGGVFGGLRTGRGYDEDGVEGDYLDHFHQPGNTKKRKVPANLAAMGPGHELGGGGGGDDEPTDRAIPTGRPERDYEVTASTKGRLGILAGGDSRKKRLSRATLAGLSHKETLRTRKRQLAAVLGALSHGDTLALDQALSANHPFARTADLQGQDLTKVRMSRRRASRLARAHKASQAQLPPLESPHPFPQSDFNFTFHSATSDRLVATKEEVSSLHARFEAELSRQAAKAAEAARQTTAMLSGTPAAKRTAKQGRTTGGQAADTKTATLEQSLGVTPQKTGKKKKRSALANASNPHHLRNYVPSRLPNSGQTNAAQALQNAQNLLTPLPIRFLSADVPPRRRKKTPVTNVPPPLTNPIEEWICPFCEYDLFYGDDTDYQRAVNNRKKVLRRRRRARERAAAAASGVAAGLTKNKANPAPGLTPAEIAASGYETESLPDESPRPVEAPLPSPNKHPTSSPAKTKGRDEGRGKASVPQTAPR